MNKNLANAFYMEEFQLLKQLREIESFSFQKWNGCAEVIVLSWFKEDPFVQHYFLYSEVGIRIKDYYHSSILIDSQKGGRWL